MKVSIFHLFLILTFPCPQIQLSLSLCRKMNSTTIEAQAQAQTQNMGSFSLGLGLSLGVLFIIITLTYASYLCNRSGLPATTPTSSTTTTTMSTTTDHHLDEVTLRHYPTLIYHRSDSTASATSGCSICLADYKDSDVLRLLPECGHVFHRQCIDPWLRLNPTCPICRSPPVRTPVETPAAGMISLRALQN